MFVKYSNEAIMNLSIESEKSCLGIKKDGRIDQVMAKRRKMNFTERPESFFDEGRASSCRDR